MCTGSDIVNPIIIFSLSSFVQFNRNIFGHFCTSWRTIQDLRMYIFVITRCQNTPYTMWYGFRICVFFFIERNSKELNPRYVFFSWRMPSTRVIDPKRICILYPSFSLHKLYGNGNAIWKSTRVFLLSGNASTEVVVSWRIIEIFWLIRWPS